MKEIHKMRLAAAVATVSSVLVLAACGGSSSSSENFSVPRSSPAAALPVPGVPVPGSAANSVAAFLTYLMSLPIGHETSEPSPITDSFAIPDDQTSDSAILS